MTENLMRKQFDELIAADYPVELKASCAWKNRLWEIFKASRKLLVVELPKLPTVHDGYTKHEINFMAYAIQECKESIEQAGITVRNK